MKHLGVCFTAALVFWLLFCGRAWAQAPIPNPTGATFTPSPDHTLIQNYVIGYFLAGATAPTLEVDLGRPTPDGQNTCTVTLNVKPLPFGNYIAKGKAVLSSGVSSEWSEPSNPFARAPLPPSGLVVK